MYIPPTFTMPKEASLALVAACDFGVLVREGLEASHIPMLLQETSDGYKLCGHMAVNNPHTEAVRAGAKALAIFSGPHAYVSPLLYSKPNKNVPTWNYAAVHITGHLKALEGDVALASIAAQVRSYEDEWNIDNLNERQLAGLLRGILPFELTIETISGKDKMSQNRSPLERNLIADKLEQQGQADVVARMRTYNE